MANPGSVLRRPVGSDTAQGMVFGDPGVGDPFQTLTAFSAATINENATGYLGSLGV